MSSTNRGSVRRPVDHYATPWEAFSVILPWLPKNIHFHDPAAGDGRLIRWLRESGRDATGSDLFPQITGNDVYPETPVDYLKDTVSKRFTITNPPFGLAQEFCDHALKNSLEVMMLLRLNFLGSQKRKEWWKLHEPDCIFVLSARPDFTGDGGDSCEYCWMYWGDRFFGIKHP